MFTPSVVLANWTDFKEFHRRLCLKFHFYNDNQMFDHLSDNEIELINFMADNLDQEFDPYKNLHKRFVDKSNWKPSRVHQSLDIFQRSFKLGLLNSKTKPYCKPNLTKQQRIGLKELSDNPDIIIKKADKGSAVVVMSTTILNSKIQNGRHFWGGENFLKIAKSTFLRYPVGRKFRRNRSISHS